MNILCVGYIGNNSKRSKALFKL